MLVNLYLCNDFQKQICYWILIDYQGKLENIVMPYICIEVM